MAQLILATICFSLSFGLIKSNLSVLPSDFVAFSRLFIAFIIFLPFIKIKNKNNIKAFLIGIIQFGIMYLCFISAFKYLQGSEIALFTTTTPIFVAIWSTMFGEKFKIIYIISILLSIIGAIFVVWNNISFHFLLKGILLMETCNCSFALGQVLWKKTIANKDNAGLMAFSYLGACLFVLIFVLANKNFTINLANNQILSILYLGIVPTAIGFWLWNSGATKINSATLAIMNNAKIPVSILFSILIFQEKVNLINFAIGSLIILSAYMLIKKSKV